MRSLAALVIHIVYILLARFYEVLRTQEVPSQFYMFWRDQSLVMTAPK